MKRLSSALAVTAIAVAPTLALVAPAHGQPHQPDARSGYHTSREPGPLQVIKQFAATDLTPRTHFVMEPDGSSGLRPNGSRIPNIDSVKSTIRTYYNADSTGIASTTDSPYISEMDAITGKWEARLDSLYAKAAAGGETPAIVFDADDTTLWTYDMEDNAMHFNFDPALQNTWVQDEKFPATPSMVDFVDAAQKAGFAIFGITGRNASQEDATLGNLTKVGYDEFNADNFYTKWTGTGDSQQPDYITCRTAKCTTVEYKAGTRAHIESQGYDIALNVGDQWSDLQGGHEDRVLKLPNPTYYLPSPNLPGVREPDYTPRTEFFMEPDGSSGKTQGGEGIPNIDSVKATIRTYYDADSSGIADKTSSPYITEMRRLTSRITPKLQDACEAVVERGKEPAIVLDADDTTLWTYDMEDGAMKFNFNPTLQNEWVQNEQFPATPAMVALVNAAHDSGCTLVGLTGRNDDQKTATMDNLAKVGYDGFTAPNYYTKWTGVGASQQPGYIQCAATKCTTIEYKSQTRAHVEDASGGGYKILMNFGDQFSDLIGGHALVPVKLPNPTYYLP